MLATRTREAYILQVRRAAAAAGRDFPSDDRAEAAAAMAIAAGHSPESALVTMDSARDSGWDNLPSLGALRARTTYERMYAGSLNRDVPGWQFGTVRAVFRELSNGSSERRAALVAWALERREANARWPRWSVSEAPDLWLTRDAVPSVIRVVGSMVPDEPVVIDGSFGVPVREAWMIVASDVAEAVVHEVMVWARAEWPDAYDILGGENPTREVRATLIEMYVRGVTLYEAIDAALDAQVAQ